MTNVFKPEGSRIDTPENKEYLASLTGLERAMNSGAIVEGIVTLCDSALRLHVDLGAAEGIIDPQEAIFCRAGEERKDIAIISRVGKPTAFVIRSIESKDKRVIAHLSRRLAQKEVVDHSLSTLHPGDLLDATVTHLEPFGAFLDIGCGVSTLLSVDCISVSRISHPRDRLKCGMTLTVAVKSMDRETGRLYVTLRELLGTWEENAARFEVGQTVTGIIRSVESYGVFIELSPNLAGLAEIREDQTEEIRSRIGHACAVYIKSIVPERMKIKLILINSYCAKPPCHRLNYYVDPATTKHLSHWIYSPIGAHRLMETVFE